MDELERKLNAHRRAVIQDLLTAIQLVESIPEDDLTPELRALQDEQRAALREDLMKVSGDSDGRQLRAMIDEFHRNPPERRAG